MVAAPYSYTGTFATSNVPVTQVETTPGSGTGGAGGTPTPTYVAGKLTFSPATVVDPQRTEGEPLNFLDPKTNDYWESGPFGTTTQNSWIHRSTDNGLEFHVDSPVGLRPDAPPGGGDTDIAVDDQGYHYFVDLEGLVNSPYRDARRRPAPDPRPATQANTTYRRSVPTRPDNRPADNVGR